MPSTRYITVILPLKLEWEPVYATDDPSVDVGSRVSLRFGAGTYVGVVSSVRADALIDPSKVRPILAVETGLDPIRPGEIALWRAVSDYYLCSIGEVYKAAYPALKQEKEATFAQQRVRLEQRLEKKRLQLEKARKDETRQRYAAEIQALENELSGKEDTLLPPLPDIKLTPAQEAAWSAVSQSFSEGKVALLKGVTGSGKTEIYMRAAAETLAGGKNVLVLVPEIALSRQLEDRFAERFGPRLMTFHSAHPAAQKRDVGAAVRSGKPYLVLGTRSALFLPHNGLGLIIVDEEHDASYKQDAPAPRYNGRDTAIMLGVISHCPVLLGSATPSLESLYNARTGRFRLVSLNERYYAAGDADIVVIDTRAERRKRGMNGSLSRKLIGILRENLEAGRQAVILRARRAYAPVIQCEACGDIPRCPHCNVPFTLHRSGDAERLVCHYCGHSEPFVPVCKTCGGTLRSLGAGTQKVEEELRNLFPEARVARLDGDTPDAEEKRIVRSFEKGETDLLVGTQIVTKGFDFSGLSLVVVLQAESLTGQQDFRADERALQLFEQFRGRSGRRGEKGRIVIQTAQPEHPVIRQFLGLAEEEGNLLEERRTFGFPPFTRMINIILKDNNLPRLERLSRQLADRLSPGLSAVGPYAPSIDKVADRHIRHIRLMLPRDRRLSDRKKALLETVLRFEKETNWTGHIALDVDPA